MGRDKILASDCFTVVKEFDGIVDQMTVPLIQGMLKYAFKSDPANTAGSCTSGSCDKEWAEGWAFAAAVLPRLHFCSTAVAEFVKANLDTANAAPMKDGFRELKAKVESTYACMGISCADVGAFQTSAGIYAGMEACTVKIAGYLPATSVVKHSKIDLDMKEISEALGNDDFAEAKRVYQNGGGGLC